MTEFVRTEDIRIALSGRATTIIEALRIPWNSAGRNRHIRCPYPDHDDRHPSWRWDPGEERAFCTCSSKGDDALAVLCKVKGIDFANAKLEAAGMLRRPDLIRKANGRANGAEVRGAADIKDIDPDRIARRERILRETISAKGTPAALYFGRRGIGDEALNLPCVGFHPDAWHGPEGDFGAIVFKATDDAGRVMAAQQVYLTTDGGKAPLNTVKRTNGLLAGAAVRLPGNADTGRIILAEGPENALSVWQPTREHTWACLGVSNIGNAPVPEGVEVIIARDADEPGSEGDKRFQQAAARLVQRGYRVRIATPSRYADLDTSDFNDMLRREGAAAVISAVVAARRFSLLNGEADAPIQPSTHQAPEIPWPTMQDAAYHGLAGDVVREILPHSEADPAAILIQVLASAGNAIGRGPYYQVEGDRHGPNIFAILVGETAKGRKGVSAGRVRQVMQGADPQWTQERVHSGLSSGEGVIWAVRDPIKEMQRQGKGASAELVETTIDNGIADKRLYVLEQEFAGALAVMKRDGSILSRIIRDAWDRGDLATMTKNNQARATGAHISVVGHITADELRRDLDRTSMANGYANRFLFVCVRRGNVLPFGGALDEETICELSRRIREALVAARNANRVEMTDPARAVWKEVYPGLSEGEPGLLGAIIGRAEAQVIRLALLYALLSRFAVIDEDHLRAALALWVYCDSSARYIFTDAVGDPIADTILRSLRQAGDDGVTRTQISTLFGRNLDAARLALALSTLERTGKATKAVRDTGGRPAEVWVAS